MRRIDECSLLCPPRAEWLTRLAYGIGNRLEKAWMGMPGGQVGDLRSLIA